MSKKLKIIETEMKNSATPPAVPKNNNLQTRQKNKAKTDRLTDKRDVGAVPMNNNVVFSSKPEPNRGPGSNRKPTVPRAHLTGPTNEDAVAVTAGGAGDPGAVQNPTSNYSAQVYQRRKLKSFKTPVERRKKPPLTGVSESKDIDQKPMRLDAIKDKMSNASKDKPVIYAIRHGRTALDTIHRSDGWLDFPLSDEGRMGLIQAQQYLKEVPISHIYAPTLKRTTETAHIIASGLLNDPKIIPSDVAKTWNLGTLMGTSKKPNKPIVSHFMEHPEEKPEGGESLKEFRDRYLPWLEERKKEVLEDGKPILLVLSGSNLRELSVQLYDDKTKLDLDEGGMLKLEYKDGKWEGKVIFGHKDEKNEYLS